MQKLIKILKAGGMAVIPTDTIYGLVGSALLPKTVEQIYALKQRRLAKPFIILINSLKELLIFGIKVNNKTSKILQEFWPGPTSIILPCQLKKFAYLHRGTDTLAFRLPHKKSLLNLLQKTGPLIAPSANPAGAPPATTITEAKKYFGTKIEMYVSGGRLNNPPSSLIRVKHGKIEVIRYGTKK